MKFNSWEDAARYCETTFGVYVNWEERFFICVECDEPILEIDWNGHDWSICPICEFMWEDAE